MGEKLELRLESLVGAEPAVYPWPLPVYSCAAFTSNSRTFHQRKGPAVPCSSPDTLCLWICLFWTFPINGITHCVSFCVWLLSLSIVFSGSVHVYLVCCSFPEHGEQKLPPHSTSGTL